MINKVMLESKLVKELIYKTVLQQVLDLVSKIKILPFTSSVQPTLKLDSKMVLEEI